jgi:hypothetical protein
MRRRDPLPACPKHPGSTVWRDGTYATARGPRPRYRCIPGGAGAERPHRFTETSGTAPRRSSYTTRDIAAALVDVGRGASYRKAAELARARAGDGASVDGNTVADWVEMYAPMVHSRYARVRWPAVLELDSVAFRARGLGEGDESTAFQIFAALAPPRRGRAQLVALEVFPRDPPGGRQALWEEFLCAHEGVPAQIVCAPDVDLVQAIAAVWPADGVSPAVFLCHRHLTHELLELLQAAGIDPGARFYRAAARALTNTASWRRFLAEPPPRRLRALDAWIDLHGPQIASQLARGAASTTTELLERHLLLLQERLADRRGNLRNRERTRRLLMLLLLELNGRSDVARYEEIISEELQQRGGRAPARRTVVEGDDRSLGG